MPIIIALAALLLLGAGCEKTQQNSEETPIEPVGPGQIELSLAALSFGEIPVGSSGNDQAFEVRNVGGSPLRVINVAASRDFTARPLCPTPLAPGETCYVVVEFAPTHSGDYNDTLVVTTDGEPVEITLPLSGRGLLGSLYVSPRSLLMTTMAPEEEKHSVVTIKNIGSHTVKNLAFRLPEKPFALSTTCSPELKAGQTCFATVSIKSEKAGEFMSAITITALHEKGATVTLKATVTDSTLTATDASSEQTNQNQ